MLEVGCGTGEYTKYVAKMFKDSKITALDISPGMIKIAREKCKDAKNVKFVCKSAYKTNLRKESFDVIFCFYTLHHLKIPQAAKEIERLLNSKGIVFFCEPNILNPIVYIIKSVKYIKEKISDTPD